GQGASVALSRFGSALRTGARFRAPRLVDARDRLFERLTAAALHGGNTRNGMRSHRRGAVGDPPANPARESIDLSGISRIDHERDGFYPSRRSAYRMRSAARREQ